MKMCVKVMCALCLAAGAVGAAAQEAETPEAVFKRAAEYDQLGKTAKAVEEYKLFLGKFQGHSQVPEVQFRLAKCQDSVGDVDGAIQNLEAATKDASKRFRNRPDALFLLGKLLGDTKEHERAVQVLERLLAEGAGLYEDDALNLCGGYYAVQDKFNEAAAKFNLLKRKPDSKYAERAAYKLAMVWLQAGNLELAVEAVGDLASKFPENQDARGLMLRIADVFRGQRKFDQALAICEQLRSRFPKSREAAACGYLVGMVYRDRKQFDKAVETFGTVAKDPDNTKSGLAAEAMMAAADVHFTDLRNVDKAMEQYEEAARLAREYTDEERRQRILEVSYFRLAEHYFAQKKWAVALEFYSLLRKVGTKVNILPRILKCQHELGLDMNAALQSEQEIEYLKKRIADNPGTFAAAEGEVFLADRELTKLSDQPRAAEPFKQVAATYEGILRRYSPKVLSEFHLESYIHVQMGRCFAGVFDAERGAGLASETWRQAIASFEKAMSADAETPYKQEILEYIASIADAAGQTKKAYETYKLLYEIAGKKVAADKSDKSALEDMTEYIKGMLTRADKADTVEGALALAKAIIEKEGVQSEAARYSFLYMGELLYMRKDFSGAAKTFRDFVKTYGPPQTAEGDVQGAPWKVETVDEKTAQVYEAAIRVAHCWYMQAHNQNMVKAYEWIVRNVPQKNKYLAEAQYWLAMELAKGKDAKNPENREALARRLWTGVVSPAYFDSEEEEPPSEPAAKKAPEKKAGRKPKDPKAKSEYYFWVHDPDMQKYVKPAMVKVGEILSELKKHEWAAEAFRRYLDLYPEQQQAPRGQPPPPPDEYRMTARYALGREYVALQEVPKMVEVYKAYIGGLRYDRFRISGLRQVGFHASTGDLQHFGVEAYATILDEYGVNQKDEKGNPIPLPAQLRIRKNSYNWDGIRFPPPANLDFGQVRYALGFLYWKNEDWSSCIKSLLPFQTDPELAKNKSRGKALYMIGRSYYKLRDFAHGWQVLWTLVQDHPDFEAVEEVCVDTARGCAEAAQWDRIDSLYQMFVKKYPESVRRPHMDLYYAIAMLHAGKREDAVDRLKSIAKSETYEDVKADALYFVGLSQVAPDLKNFRPASDESYYRHGLTFLDTSIQTYPRERACVAAARCCMALKEWERAKGYLERATRDFPDGEARFVNEAKALLPIVLQEVAKIENKGK